MQDGYGLCYPAVTPHILTGNQINSVSGSGGPAEAKAPQAHSTHTRHSTGETVRKSINSSHRWHERELWGGRFPQWPTGSSRDLVVDWSTWAQLFSFDPAVHINLSPHLHQPLLLAPTLSLPTQHPPIRPRCVCVCVLRGGTALLWNIFQQSSLKEIDWWTCVCECKREKVSDSEHIWKWAWVLFFCFSVVFHVNCMWWTCSRRRHPSKWQSNQNTCPCKAALVITLLRIGWPLCSAKCFMIVCVR